LTKLTSVYFSKSQRKEHIFRQLDLTGGRNLNFHRLQGGLMEVKFTSVGQIELMEDKTLIPRRTPEPAPT
jgi:hypothetical protein